MPLTPPTDFEAVALVYCQAIIAQVNQFVGLHPLCQLTINVTFKMLGAPKMGDSCTQHCSKFSDGVLSLINPLDPPHLCSPFLAHSLWNFEFQTTCECTTRNLTADCLGIDGTLSILSSWFPSSPSSLQPSLAYSFHFSYSISSTLYQLLAK